MKGEVMSENKKKEKVIPIPKGKFFYKLAQVWKEEKKKKEK